MLSNETPSSQETRAAVTALLKSADFAYGKMSSVDMERIRSCLGQANTVSKTSAVKQLVKTYCAPGVSDRPLNNLFKDAAECDRKMAAIYDL